jgi:hypothetical protein
MAMTPSEMGDAIYTGMEAEYWPGISLPAEGETELKRYYTCISKAIIEYIKKNGEALPGTFNVPSVGNVVGVGKIQ